MFERVAVPTPFQIGPVNAYVAGRTVVDPGPDSEDARETLADALAERDLALADVERVLVTHPHPDHFGLANHLRSEGAEVWASPGAAAILREFERRLDYEQAYFSALFRAHGMGAETARTVTRLPEAFVEYAPSTAVDRELHDGAAVEIAGGSDPGGRGDAGGDGDEAGDSADGAHGRDAADATLDVRALEGHAVGEIALEFGVGDDRAAIVGDHVLGGETPNPFLQPPADGWEADRSTAQRRDATPDFAAADPAGLDDQRPRALLAYNDSLERLRALAFDRLLPGHGDPIEDPAARIDELLAAHEERTDAVRDAVAATEGGATATDVMRALFPDLAVIDYFPGMSEALGHLDVLVERGVVGREAHEGELVYEIA